MTSFKVTFAFSRTYGSRKPCMRPREKRKCLPCLPSKLTLKCKIYGPKVGLIWMRYTES